MSVFNQSRNRVVKLIFIVAFILIIAQLINLQLFNRDYAKLAMNQAVFPKIIYPERGLIYDRNNKALLTNTIMYDLMVTPSEIKNLDTVGFCQVLEIDTATFKKRVNDAIFKNGRMRPSIFQPLLHTQTQARLEENSWRFPGFAIVERPVRSYPFNSGSHILGYINEVDTSDIRKSEGFYRQGDYTGKSGLEAYYEKTLMGQRGVQYWLKDNFNRLVGQYEGGRFDTLAVAGRSLRTYIDAELQQMAERMLDNKVGAVVAIDPQTGGILAMASGPTYNPNDLTGYDRGKNFSKMALNVASPLLNRAITARYEPGSTFKPIGGLIALNEGLITPAWGYPCGGVYPGCGIGKPKCTHAGGGHAANLRRAVANSCNSFFTHVYRLAVDNPKYGGVKKGYMKWREYMFSFGFGTRLGVDLPSEIPGFIPDTSVYDKENNGHWSSCTNLTLGIGQDKMLTTPLQLANAMCIIANKGYYYTPHLVRKIDNETEEDSLFMQKFRTRHDVLTHISDSAYSAMINGMEDVVTMGTAKRVRIPGIDVCAKTGTAQNFTILRGRRIPLEHNALFVCFAPKQNPKIAIAVIIQNAGYGGTWGGPIARILMEKYLQDTLNKASKAEYERLCNTSKMPPHLKTLQYITDSARARFWFEKTKDSNYIKKYLHKTAPRKTNTPGKEEEKEKNTIKRNITYLLDNRKNMFRHLKPPTGESV